ncbi:hypothetical protein BYT27DRAFT_7208040 [Phlegmacium glaucopus]|nr:hypothetical protein BYT27DRAFT_7208040 [Phlegmacium glaucopus]
MPSDEVRREQQCSPARMEWPDLRYEPDTVLAGKEGPRELRGKGPVRVLVKSSDWVCGKVCAQGLNLNGNSNYRLPLVPPSRDQPSLPHKASYVRKELLKPLRERYPALGVTIRIMCKETWRTAAEKEAEEKFRSTYGRSRVGKAKSGSRSDGAGTSRGGDLWPEEVQARAVSTPSESGAIVPVIVEDRRFVISSNAAARRGESTEDAGCIVGSRSRDGSVRRRLRLEAEIDAAKEKAFLGTLNGNAIGSYRAKRTTGNLVLEPTLLPSRATPK